MASSPPKALHYRRSHFATQLPLDYLYSPAHAWLARQPNGCWRVGFTKFATRMLGESVDHAFQLEPGMPVEPGQILGWVEGFKAISDLYCVARGAFAGGNPMLKEKLDLINDDPYGAGWLYEVQGEPDPNHLDAYGYRDLLDKTIDRLLQQQKNAETE